ncbi:MAG: VCBS repeat-containing protein [Planctomycetes bacterium]|nr:VCBS repeat-containing protein [Planctomycetota bacterium]
MLRNQHRRIRAVTVIGVAVIVFSAWLPAAAQQTIRFVDVTERAGLRKPLAGIMGHGGAWGDFDGDGRIDLYVGGFADRPNDQYAPAKGPPANRLFRNLGDGRFAPAKQASVEFFGRTSGAVFADLDNNGTLELYVANNCKGRSGTKSEPQRSAQLRYSNLFRNDGGKFIDISKASGACPKSLGTARNVGVFDYDGDGLLDLLVLEDKFTRNPRSVLYRNMGKLKFKDVNAQVGLPDDIFGLGLDVADINNDGRPDFFVGHSNRLFLSTAGGKYYEPPELKKLFAWKPVNSRDREDWPCGVCFGDLNRDGLLDLVVSIHHERARNRVYLNQGIKNGVPQFRDVSAAVGIPAELPSKSPHVEIQDFDNDGWPDLYFSTAWLDKDGSITLSVKAGHELEIIPRVLALGGEAEVLSPKSCRQAIANTVRKMAKRYDKDD